MRALLVTVYNCDAKRVRRILFFLCFENYLGVKLNVLQMSCCSAKTIEDKIQPYELRSVYINQIKMFSKRGLFAEAVRAFREVG